MYTGEILIRKCLTKVLTDEFKMLVDTITSDQQFERVDGSIYDIIILDPWTWAAKGRCIPMPQLYLLLDILYTYRYMYMDKYYIIIINIYV